MTLADRIKALRKGQGLSNSELGRRAKFGYGVAKQLQNGMRTNPTFDSLVRIAQAFGLSVSELLSDVDAPEASRRAK